MIVFFLRLWVIVIVKNLLYYGYNTFGGLMYLIYLIHVQLPSLRMFNSNSQLTYLAPTCPCGSEHPRDTTISLPYPR